MTLVEKMIHALTTKEAVQITGFDFVQSISVIKSPIIQRDHEQRVQSGAVDYFAKFRPLAHDNVSVGYYTGPSVAGYESGSFYLIDGNTRRHFYHSVITNKQMTARFPSVIDIMEKPFYLRVVEFDKLSDLDATYNCLDTPDQTKSTKDNMYSAGKVCGIVNVAVWQEITSVINKLTVLEGKRKQFQQDGISDIQMRNVQVKMLGGSTKIDEAIAFADACGKKLNKSERQRLVMFFFYTEKEERAEELRQVIIDTYNSTESRAINEKTSYGMTPEDYLSTVIKLGNKTNLLACAGGNSSIMYSDVMLHAAKKAIDSNAVVLDWGVYDFENTYAASKNPIKKNFDDNIRVKASRADMIELAK